MEKQTINPWTWQDQLGFTQGVLVTEPRQRCTPPARVPSTPTATSSTRATSRPGRPRMDNVETVLAAAGMTLRDVVRYDIYTTDIDGYFPASGELTQRLGSPAPAGGGARAGRPPRLPRDARRDPGDGGPLSNSARLLDRTAAGRCRGPWSRGSRRATRRTRGTTSSRVLLLEARVHPLHLALHARAVHPLVVALLEPDPRGAQQQGGGLGLLGRFGQLGGRHLLGRGPLARRSLGRSLLDGLRWCGSTFGGGGVTPGSAS